MINEYKFGSFKVNNVQYIDDIKLINDKVKYWQTRYRHTLRIDDIKDLVLESPDYFIIGTGASGLLQVGEDVREFLLSKRIRVIVEKTSQAVETYNKYLGQSRKVVAILHATC